MTLQLWGLYASAVVLLCLTPGPNSVLAIANGIQHGVRKTFFSTLGCAFGLVLLIGISMSGMGLILSTSETLFSIIKWLGAAYLIYLGIGLIRSKKSLIANTHKVNRTKVRSNTSLFLQGFLIIATNPKVLIFFTAFLPQFYVKEASLWSQFVILAVTFVIVEVIVEILLALFSSKIATYGKSGKGLAAFTNITGGVFVLAGAYLLTMERPK